MVPKAKPGSKDEGKVPSADELAGLLGTSNSAFLALTHDRARATCEWKRYGTKSPWVLKVSEGDRTLFYVTPQANQFEVTVVLGERAAQAALAGRVRGELHAAIRSAKPYVEGRAVRVVVAGKADLAGVAELVAVKLKPASASTVAQPSKVARRGRTSGCS
jgi:Protein of unknown function (DUF3788)